MAEWRIELFGGLTILRDGVPTAQAVSARTTTKDLLALLVLEKGRGIDGDTLAARLWPESTPWHALESLHTAASRLRVALGDDGKDILVVQGQLYRIDDAKVTTDVADFDHSARTITFAEGLDDDVKAALDRIEGLYKGNLLGRGQFCRNRVLRAYNDEYRSRVIGVWEVAAGLYLERGDMASRTRATWYAQNINRLQDLKDADTRAVCHRDMVGEQTPRPSIRARLVESRQTGNAMHGQRAQAVSGQGARARAANHDEVMVSGARAPWREVLAVYAVRTTTDTAGPQDAITLDERRQRILREVYWDMTIIEYRTEDRDYTEIVAVEREDGSIVEETQVHTRRTLYITQGARTAKQMADAYGFDDERRGLLAELLSPEYASAWQSVLYGIRSGSGDIVEVAASQIGNPGGQPYWSWYGFGSRVEWCACFVSWCASEVGYIEGGLIPRFSYCQTGIGWFQDAGCWQPAGTGYVPQSGDIIFFEWGDGGDSDHVGIVESCDGTTVRTIEGNSGDEVRRRSYRLDSASIVGYGTPGQQG